jgi:hypothetical protein
VTVRKVRRSQVISPFGPGAIIDLVGESFVVEDAGKWRPPHVPVDFPRLASYLGVDSLASPSPSPRRPIPYYRFPQWLFCPACRRMIRWSYKKEVANAAPTCEHCPGDKQLIPMRFVAVCGDGHLSDVDWFGWAHSAMRRDRDQKQCQRHFDLKFLNKANVGGGLNSLVVRCLPCGVERSLDGLTTSVGLKHIGSKCTGRQPWQDAKDEKTCSKQVVAMQRGASSVYFPTVVSAIDIPPESAWASVSDPVTALMKSSEFKFLVAHPGYKLAKAMIEVAADDYGLSVVEVEAALARQMSDPHTPVDGGPENIRPDEWAALINPQDSHHPLDQFISRRADRPLADSGKGAGAWGRLIPDVVLVDRLREVRVLTHFERYTMDEKVPSNLSADADFLPAIEVFGEGFFLKFDEEALARWEQSGPVVDRCRKLAERQELKGAKWLPEPTPRYVLLHTFAHLLLRNTAFEAGYSTSSLHERLYVTTNGVGPAMAGVLIYTAAGDAEGTLGGLVRMGESPRLGRLLDMSITAALWCSFDPVCADHPGQGPDGLSLAACHACSLTPETSCEAANRLLDRRLLVDPEFGFFKDLAAAAGSVPGSAL